MIVSDVGRMISSSSSFASGSTIRPLPLLGLEPVVRDDGALLGEALGHLLFLGEEALGDEQREVGVDVAGVLEQAVEGALHLLPDGVAVRLDDHAAADVGVLGQPGLLDDVEVPLGIVGARGVIFSAMCGVLFPGSRGPYAPGEWGILEEGRARATRGSRGGHGRGRSPSRRRTSARMRSAAFQAVREREASITAKRSG